MEEIGVAANVKWSKQTSGKPTRGATILYKPLTIQERSEQQGKKLDDVGVSGI